MEPKPKQRIPESQKNREWRINALRYWNDISMTSLSDSNDYRNLEIAAGKIKETDYDYLLNPFHLKGDKFNRRPAKLRNFDFISSLFLRLISEFDQRDFTPIVYTINSQFDTEKANYQKQLVTQSLQQRFVNMMTETGLFDPNQTDEAGNPVQPPLSPEAIKAQVSSLKDLKTMQGQNAIDFISADQELKRKFKKAFDYLSKTNKCATYRDIRNDGVIFESVSPLDIDYYGDTDFLEDCEAIRNDLWLSIPQVIEIFGKSLEEYKDEYGDLLEKIESLDIHGKNGNAAEYFTDVFMKNKGQEIKRRGGRSSDGRVKVRHIQFTSFRLVKRILDEEGNIVNLTEDYQGDDVIEEVWYPQEREGYVIADQYFIGGFANEVQLQDPDNPFKTKKNYNGRVFMKGEVEQSAMPEKLFMYQEAVNAVEFKMQDAINKDKGKLLVMPLSLLTGFKNTGVSNNITYKDQEDVMGTNVEFKREQIVDYQTGKGAREESSIGTTLHYAATTQLLFVDDSKEGFANAIQAIKAVDLSLANYIEWLDQRAQRLRSDAENLLGFNNARTGGIKASETVTNSQQNLYSGSLITEQYFKEMEELIARDLQFLLDLSKYAYKVGFKKNYVRNNMDIELLEIDEGFFEASYGIFVRSSAKTKEVLDNLKMQATQMLQNFHKGGSTLARILASTGNYATIIAEIEAKENEFMEQQAQKEQADRESNERIAEINLQDKREERELKLIDINTRQQTEIMKAGITGVGFNIGGEDGADRATAIMAETNKMIAIAQQNQLKMREIISKEKIEKGKLEVKREEIAANKYVAKVNKN